MGIEIIATNVVTIVTPIVKKGSDAATAKLGKTLFGQANGLLRRMKSELSGNKEADNTVESFELNPSRYKTSLQEILLEELRGNEDLTNQLAVLINEMGPLSEVAKKIGSLEGKAISLGTEKATPKKFTPSRNNKSTKPSTPIPSIAIPNTTTMMVGERVA